MRQRNRLDACDGGLVGVTRAPSEWREVEAGARVALEPENPSELARSGWPSGCTCRIHSRHGGAAQLLSAGSPSVARGGRAAIFFFLK
jgi:hypothetical protein